MKHVCGQYGSHVFQGSRTKPLRNTHGCHVTPHRRVRSLATLTRNNLESFITKVDDVPQELVSLALSVVGAPC